MWDSPVSGSDNQNLKTTCHMDRLFQPLISHPVCSYHDCCLGKGYLGAVEDWGMGNLGAMGIGDGDIYWGSAGGLGKGEI